MSCHSSHAVAAFISRLFLGSESGGIVNSLHAASVAGSGSGSVAAVCSTLLFLYSALHTSSASASLITSFLRSSLSAPCGEVLMHLSIRSLQRCECACALLLSLIALQPSHPTVAPNFSMSCLRLRMAVEEWNRIFSNFWFVHYTPVTLLTASLSHFEVPTF